MSSTNDDVKDKGAFLDGWLLHSHPTCPIDGQLVWSAEIDAEQRQAKRYVEQVDCTKDETLTAFDLFSSAPPPMTRHVPKHSSQAFSSSSLLSVNMGLSVTPYQLRPLNVPNSNDPNQRYRRLHLRAPLRPLISATHDGLSSTLEINAQSFGARAILLNNDEQRRERQAPLLTVDEAGHVNNELRHDLSLPAGISGRRLLDRRCSNSK